MKFGLHESTIRAVHHVLRQYPAVETAIIFGSRAMGNFRPASDIDLVLIGPKLDLSTQFKIENALDDLLLPYTIDLSILHRIDTAELLDHIHRVGQVFYEKKEGLEQEFGEDFNQSDKEEGV